MLEHKTKHIDVQVFGPDEDLKTDAVTLEEPLEIWIAYKDKDGKPVEYSLSITMRTPGDDEALAVGFLYTEGIVSDLDDIENVEFFGPFTEPLMIQNQIKIYLNSHERIAEKNYQRYFYSNSSCGVCGKSSIKALELLHQPEIEENSFRIHDRDLRQLPGRLRVTQTEFDRTGGLHGVALVNQEGEILLTMEDVGRHNALDKLIGSLLLNSSLKVKNKMVLVSGRVSFELVQKALMADIPFMAAISAPSSAAVDLAKAFDMTLVGFLGNNEYNIYNKAHRIFT